jgi:hypothetical protein
MSMGGSVPCWGQFKSTGRRRKASGNVKIEPESLQNRSLSLSHPLGGAIRIPPAYNGRNEENR